MIIGIGTEMAIFLVSEQMDLPREMPPRQALLEAACNRGRLYKMTATKLGLAQAAMGQPGTKVGELCAELGVTRQTLYRHVDPKGQLRPDGLSLLARRRTPAVSVPTPAVQAGRPP